MQTFALTKEEYDSAAKLARHYYGIDIDDIEAGLADIIVIDTSNDVDSLRQAYLDCFHLLDHKSENILNCLALLSSFILNNAPKVDEDSYGNALKKLIRKDLLKLYVFFNETEIDPGAISIRGGKGSVRLQNSCNWFWELLAGKYLKEHIPDIDSTEKAESELESMKNKRGRQYNDSRIPLILWGTFQLLSESHNFSTPMPNALCNFIVKVLQAMKIITEDSEIDAFWVRAELRYIKSRKENILDLKQSATFAQEVH